MIHIRNGERRYGAPAIALHWLMALLLSALVALGLYMTSLPDVGFDTWKIRLIIYHKQLGLLAFMLVALRLVWRIGNVLPQLLETIPDWQKVLARFVHLCFYALMLALPVTGWLMSSAAGIPVSALGLFALPDLVPYDDRLFHTLIAVHHYLGYALMICMAAHIGAAFVHHFLLKDSTLKTMLPGLDAARKVPRLPPVRTGPSAAGPSQWPR
jgi:cytochrome b561